MICKSWQYPSHSPSSIQLPAPFRLLSRATSRLVPCIMHTSSLLSTLLAGAISKKGTYASSRATRRFRGRSFKELLLRHTSNHSRGWRCINVSRGITSPDVSISGSQLFIGRAPVSMPSVLSSVIDQLLLLAIQVKLQTSNSSKTFWEIILEITCYIIIKKKKGNGVVEKRRDNSNEILNRLCAILYLQRKTNSNLQLSSIELL